MSGGALTAPKEGADARVGLEMGNEMGYFIRRTKRVEELLAQPAIMREADRIAEHVDRWCAIEAVEVREVEPTILPTQTKRYITIYIGARECYACAGTMRDRAGASCSVCHGTGVR